MESVSVSVIIPNYCHAAYLPERIESVLNQSYRNFEVIILDDCSTDNSREVIERYGAADPRIRHIVFNETNSGSTFRQWQKGFELAAGEYIWIAESDDVAMPDFLESCMAQFDAHPTASVVFSDCIFVDAATQPVADTRLSKALARKRGGCTFYTGREFLTKKLVLQNFIANASMTLFRKSAIPTDREYTTYRYVGDWLFWAGCAENGDVVYIDRQLDLFRQHGSNTTSKSLVGGKNYDETQRMLAYLIKRLGLSSAYSRYLYGKQYVRLKRKQRTDPVNAEIYRSVYERWQKEWPSAFLCRLWYRAAKLCGIYR